MSEPPTKVIKNPARLAALRRTLLLDSPGEAAFDRLTRLATRFLHAPISLVSLVDQDRQFFLSSIGLPEPWASRRETPLSHAFCQHEVTSGTPLIIEDARTHPLVRDNPAIPDLNVVAYAGIPLITGDGHVIGSFCVIDTEPRRWTADEIATLRDLAAGVMTEIELRVTMLEVQQRADEAERERREKVDILESITDAFFALDQQWCFRYVNAAAEQVLQRPRAALLGRCLWQEFPEAIDSVFYHAYQQAVADHVTVAFEAFYAPLGIWVDVRAYPTADGLSVYFHDINERKAMEASLRTGREWLARILETAADGIAIVNMAGHITFANASAEQILGLTRSTLAERTYDDPAWRITTLDGLPFPQHELPPAQVLRTGTAVYDVEFAIVRPDGTQAVLTVNAAPLRDANGALEGVVVSFTDRTAQTRAETAQQFLLEASEVLASSLDYTTTLKRLVHLTVPHLADWCTVHILADGVLERPVATHRDPEQEHLLGQLQGYPRLRLDADHPLANVLRTGEPRIEKQIDRALLQRWIPDPDMISRLQALGLNTAMLVPLVVRGQSVGVLSFMRGESGRPYDDADLQLAQDLAHRCALAVDNAQLYREAQQALQDRDHFLSTVSHDLKQPLGAITAYVGLVQRRLAPVNPQVATRIRDSLGKIDAAATRMKKLIDELLDVARLRAGQPLELDISPTDLVALVRRTAADQQQMAPHHKIHVRSTVAELAADHDATRLERVLTNLLSNAVKYSPGGSEITVTISEDVVGPKRYAVMEVHDQGLGIPAEDLPHIFQRFRRGTNVQGRIGGSGIGLASARQIVEQHGGTLTVTSTEGCGSTFSVRLPRASTASE